MENGNRVLAGGLFLGGTVALALTAVMNFNLGQTLGADYWGGIIQGMSHVTIDAMAAIGFVAAGVLLARTNWVAGLLAFSLSLAFATYSVANIIGYSASNRVAVAAASASNTAQIAKMADAAVATRAEALKWAMATATDKTKYRSMREPMADLVAKLATAPQENFKAVSARDVMPDAQAQIIADMTGFSERNAQVGLSIAMAILIVLAKAFGFGFGGFLTSQWPRGGQDQAKVDQDYKSDLDENLARETPVFDLRKIPANDYPEQGCINHIHVFSRLHEPGPHSFEELKHKWEMYQKETGCDPMQPWALANALKPYGWHKNEKGLWVKNSVLKIAA